MGGGAGCGPGPSKCLRGRTGCVCVAREPAGGFFQNTLPSSELCGPRGSPSTVFVEKRDPEASARSPPRGAVAPGRAGGRRGGPPSLGHPVTAGLALLPSWACRAGGAPLPQRGCPLPAWPHTPVLSSRRGPWHSNPHVPSCFSARFDVSNQSDTRGLYGKTSHKCPCSAWTWLETLRTALVQLVSGRAGMEMLLGKEYRLPSTVPAPGLPHPPGRGRSPADGVQQAQRRVRGTHVDAVLQDELVDPLNALLAAPGHEGRDPQDAAVEAVQTL